MKKLNGNIVGGVLIFLHLVGVVGYLTPFLRPLFLFLTPFNLLLSGVLLMYYHERHTLRFWAVSSIIIVFGFLIEVAGVQTGLIFGEYQYLTTLGFKVWDVPPIIGLNWFLLVYTSADLSRRWLSSRIYRIMLGSIVMVILDLLIEPVAVSYQYWEWLGGEGIPIQNYIAWFVIAACMQVLFHWKTSTNKNVIAPYLLVAQLLYFLALNIL